MRWLGGLIVACVLAGACTPDEWQQVCEVAAPQERVQTHDVCRWLPVVAERWPVEEWGNALVIIAWESGGRPDAVNWGDPSGGSHGLFQINGVHGYTRAELVDPGKNMDAAYALWLEKGWKPWAAKRFLGR